MSEKLSDEVYAKIGHVSWPELAVKYVALKAKLEAVTQSLYDVAHGMVPASFSLDGDPLEVRSRLFTWSQERARAGLAAAQQEQEDE